MCSITCTCGHTGDFETFTRNTLGQDLPRGHYQCPVCKLAWKVTYAPGTWHFEGSLYIPGQGKIEPVQPEL